MSRQTWTNTNTVRRRKLQLKKKLIRNREGGGCYRKLSQVQESGKKMLESLSFSSPVQNICVTSEKHTYWNLNL